MVSHCIVVLVLFSVFYIFCVTSFGDHNFRNTKKLKEELNLFTAYLDFVFEQILDFAVLIFCLLTKEKCLLKQKNMAFFSFSSELLGVEYSE